MAPSQGGQQRRRSSQRRASGEPEGSASPPPRSSTSNAEPANEADELVSPLPHSSTANAAPVNEAEDELVSPAPHSSTANAEPVNVAHGVASPPPHSACVINAEPATVHNVADSAAESKPASTTAPGHIRSWFASAALTPNIQHDPEEILVGHGAATSTADNASIRPNVDTSEEHRFIPDDSIQPEAPKMMDSNQENEPHPKRTLGSPEVVSSKRRKIVHTSTVAVERGESANDRVLPDRGNWLNMGGQTSTAKAKSSKSQILLHGDAEDVQRGFEMPTYEGEGSEYSLHKPLGEDESDRQPGSHFSEAGNEDGEHSKDDAVNSGGSTSAHNVFGKDIEGDEKVDGMVLSPAYEKQSIIEEPPQSVTNAESPSGRNSKDSGAFGNASVESSVGKANAAAFTLLGAAAKITVHSQAHQHDKKKDSALRLEEVASGTRERNGNNKAGPSDPKAPMYNSTAGVRGPKEQVVGEEVFSRSNLDPVIRKIQEGKRRITPEEYKALHQILLENMETHDKPTMSLDPESSIVPVIDEIHPKTSNAAKELVDQPGPAEEPGSQGAKNVGGTIMSVATPGNGKKRKLDSDEFKASQDCASEINGRDASKSAKKPRVTDVKKPRADLPPPEPPALPKPAPFPSSTDIIKTFKGFRNLGQMNIPGASTTREAGTFNHVPGSAFGVYFTPGGSASSRLKFRTKLRHQRFTPSFNLRSSDMTPGVGASHQKSGSGNEISAQSAAQNILNTLEKISSSRMIGLGEVKPPAPSSTAKVTGKGGNSKPYSSVTAGHLNVVEYSGATSSLSRLQRLRKKALEKKSTSTPVPEKTSAPKNKLDLLRDQASESMKKSSFKPDGNSFEKPSASPPSAATGLIKKSAFEAPAVTESEKSKRDVMPPPFSKPSIPAFSSAPQSAAPSAALPLDSNKFSGTPSKGFGAGTDDASSEQKSFLTGSKSGFTCDRPPPDASGPESKKKRTLGEDLETPSKERRKSVTFALPPSYPKARPTSGGSENHIGSPDLKSSSPIASNVAPEKASEEGGNATPPAAQGLLNFLSKSPDDSSKLKPPSTPFSAPIFKVSPSPPPAEANEKPIAGKFSFGGSPSAFPEKSGAAGSQAELSKPDTPAAPSFSFPAAQPSSGAAPPSFSFGAPKPSGEALPTGSADVLKPVESPKPSPSYKGKRVEYEATEDEPPKKRAFEFGSAPSPTPAFSVASAASTAPGFSSGPSAPAFSFGSSASAMAGTGAPFFSFGKTADKPADQAEKPVPPPFGSPAERPSGGNILPEKPSAPPAFSFGSTPASGAPVPSPFAPSAPSASLAPSGIMFGSSSAAPSSSASLIGSTQPSTAALPGSSSSGPQAGAFGFGAPSVAGSAPAFGTGTSSAGLFSAAQGVKPAESGAKPGGFAFGGAAPASSPGGFGGGAGVSFGASSSAGGTPFLFGGPAGGSSSAAFGSSAPAFGSSGAMSSAAPAFGAASAASVVPLFGSPMGASSTPAFGGAGSSAPSFGAGGPAGSPFGAPNASSGPAFGAGGPTSSFPSFGAPSSAAAGPSFAFPPAPGGGAFLSGGGFGGAGGFGAPPPDAGGAAPFGGFGAGGGFNAPAPPAPGGFNPTGFLGGDAAGGGAGGFNMGSSTAPPTRANRRVLRGRRTARK